MWISTTTRNIASNHNEGQWQPTMTEETQDVSASQASGYVFLFLYDHFLLLFTTYDNILLY